MAKAAASVIRWSDASGGRSGCAACTESFSLTRPQLVEKIRRGGLYVRHRQCRGLLDGRESQIQALQRAQPILPMDFGQPDDGPTTTYAMHAGSVRRPQCGDRRGDRTMQAPTSARTLSPFCAASARRADVTSFVLDNLSAHRRPPAALLIRHPRVHFISRRPTRRAHLVSASSTAHREALTRSHTSIPQLRGHPSYVTRTTTRRRSMSTARDPHTCAASLRAAGPRSMTRLILEMTDPGTRAHSDFLVPQFFVPSPPGCQRPIRCSR